MGANADGRPVKSEGLAQAVFEESLEGEVKPPGALGQSEEHRRGRGNLLQPPDLRRATIGAGGAVKIHRLEERRQLSRAQAVEETIQQGRDACRHQLLTRALEREVEVERYVRVPRRELEGALVKLIAYSSVTGTPITLQLAQQILKHLTGGQEKRITIESVVKAVAEKFNLQSSQLKQKTNEHKIAYPRQIAMYLIKELTAASLPEIGRWFSGKHHTTVLHSVQKIDKLRQKDTDLNNLLHRLVESIH